MLRSLLLCLFGISALTAGKAQITVTGTLTDDLSGLPLSGVRISSELPDETQTDANGMFFIQHPEAQDIFLRFELEGEVREFVQPRAEGDTIDLGVFSMVFLPDLAKDLDLPTITVEGADVNLDASISGLLQSGDDLFANMTDFTFSPARFRRRGMGFIYTEGYLNNLPMNDLESGGVFWRNWGGLNDVMRINDNVIGAEIADWGFGGLASTFNTDLRASSHRKQTKVSYAVTNRSYRNRIMGTWSTGLLPSGWAITLSGSRRWAQEGYFEGTFYDAWSYFASVEKRFNASHALNFVLLGAPYHRGANSRSVQEMYDLADSPYYNSYWGYQEGKKRSARNYSGHIPLFLLRHDFNVNEKITLTTSLGYHTGTGATSALDWLDANDPRPDYYRRLPSYVDDPQLADFMTDYLSTNTDQLQVQWDDMYRVNLNSSETIEDVDGIPGNDVTGALSQYVFEDRNADLQKASANIVLQYQLNENSQLHAGFLLVNQDTRNYKTINDLLGGEFYVDWDKFAEQDFPGDDDALQNDLLRPNRLVYEGDQFGYDYYARIRQRTGWITYILNASKWEFSISGSLSQVKFWRDGQTQNGRFPNNSLGESEKEDFLLPSGKALLRYKFDGRNYLTISGMYTEAAPTFRNSFVSPRTRNSVVEGLTKEIGNLLELRYDYRAPDLKFSVSGFYITTVDAIRSTSFYHDDLNTFVNFSLTGIDQEHIGIEAAIDYSLTPSLSLQGAASIGQYIYTSRPKATITQDNDGTVLLRDITVYAQNFYVPSTPQSAYTGGLTYRSKNYWSVFLNVNYFQEGWLDFNPLRRTLAATDGVEYPSAQWDAIIDQEKIDPAWTVDLSFYKSWLIQPGEKRTFLSLNFGINNILNNESYINGGYEQYRFDYETKDPSVFPSKYSYMQGLNYFIQIGLRY